MPFHTLLTLDPIPASPDGLGWGDQLALNPHLHQGAQRVGKPTWPGPPSFLSPFLFL